MGKQTIKLTNKDFVHLHNHTEYSLLDGLTKIPKLMEFVKNEGMQAVAITDHGTLSGLIEFYKEAIKNELKPILGLETYIAQRSYLNKEVSLDKNNYHLILLAKNNQGYQNLMKLSTIANLDGYYYKPRIDRQLLNKYSEGLIVLSGCMGSEIGQALLEDNYSQAIKIAKMYHDIFKDDYYLEIQDHGHPDHPTLNKDQYKINESILKISKELNIKVVLTCDAHYLAKKDQIIHEILLCVQTNSYLSEENRFSMKDIDLHVISPDELIKRWNEYPEVILNTKEIADKCQVSLALGSTLIPRFPLPNKQKESDYLVELTLKGLYKRYLNQEVIHPNLNKAKDDLPENILNRALYELDVINKMNYAGYFLIVQDFINWGKGQDIIFGPGRGSAAGSIVAYALNITEINPIKYNLMFERFLNPSRITMPDIDIDIQDNRRDEVINYCVNKYGFERVANIVTFGRMAARNAVRDVARVLEVPYAEADRLAKMIPGPIQGRHIPLKESIQNDQVLHQEYLNNEQSSKILDYATEIEGTIRSHGIHAAGVVIAPDDIDKFVPLEMAQKGVVATQYPMGPIEELGLLKIDFLGLSNLTTIKNCLRIIKKVYKEKIDLSQIPDDDQKTFQIFQNGNTTGVFQFESSGMKKYLKELKPNRFEDIVAMNALYRPGPMLQIPKFIQGKIKPNEVVYVSNYLEPVLKDTYGAIVYQEQIIQLLQVIAGYTPGEADLVRKAIGKKNRDIMDKEHPKFIHGCLEKGLSKKDAEELWSLIQPFADYSFNKAHATCYSMIAYYTAYLKANYPIAFMAALLTSDYDQSDRLAIDIKECYRLSINVKPPDINNSFVEFGVSNKDNSISFGLKAIKNVGFNAAEHIVSVRGKNNFTSLENFLERVDHHIINKKVLESLIKVGCFDSFNSRKIILENIDLLLSYANQHHKNINTNQIDLFSETLNTGDFNKLKLISQNTDISTHQYLIWERELLGIYLSKHPLDDFKEYIIKHNSEVSKFSLIADNSLITIIGLIQNIHQIMTKSKQAMAFIKIESIGFEEEVVCFPKTYLEYKEILNLNDIYSLHIRIKHDKDKGTSFIVEDIQKLDLDKNDQKVYLGPGAKSLHQNSKKTLYIKINNLDDSKSLIKLKNQINLYKGEDQVVLVVKNNSSKQAIKIPELTNCTKENIDIIKEIFGSENVVLR